ncbi:MAG: LptF/LptG family permease [Verrucomicrobia bacterium]|nr:LptF/LptG family permease [Verrucomicrobiota bacterium]
MKYLKLNIFDRYIWRQVFSSMLIGVIVLTGVMVLGNVFKEMERLLGDTSSLPLSAVLKFISFVIPYSLIFTIPWAMLTGILLVFGRMSADNEMTALRMTGRSMPRICAPVFVLAICMSVVCYFVNVNLAPYCKNSIKRLFFDLTLDRPEMLFQPGKVVDKFPGYTIYTGARDDKKLHNVEIFESDGGYNRRYTRATRAEVVLTPGETDFVLRLHNAHIETPKETEDKNVDVLNDLQSINLAESAITFPLSKLMGKSARISASMKDTDTLWQEVRSGIDSTTGKAADKKLISASLTEANMRYSFSLACITFAFVGIPLGITAQRRETSVGFALSLLVAASYIIFITFADSVKEKASYYPHLLMWVPNVIFLSVGGVLFYRLSRK